MKKRSLHASIQKLFIVSLLFFLVIGVQSCSNESEINSDENAVKTTTQFSTKSTEPVEKLDGTFVEVDLISWANNCFRYQVRIVIVYQGRRSIGHSAIIQTGSGCDEEGLVTNSYEGDYKGDFIIKDELPTGQPIRTYFDNNQDVYQDYVNERDKVIADIK